METLEWQQLDLRYERLRCVEPQAEARLSASLCSVGQQAPIIVLQAPAHVVVDGFKRVRCLRKLGQDAVRALRWELPEAAALLLQHQGRGQVSALEEAWLLLELSTQFGHSEEELARQLVRSKSWVSRRLGLVVTLSAEIQQLVRTGKVQAYAATRFLLPLARANTADADKLARAAAREQWTTRQLAELYRAYMGSTDQSRSYLVENPSVVLRARQQAQREEAPTLVNDAVAIGRMAARLRKKLRAFAGVVSPEERSRLQSRLNDAATSVDDCVKESAHVGQGAARGGVDIEEAGPGDQGHRPGAAGEPQRGQTLLEDGNSAKSPGAPEPAG
jgi:ParB/RepB/Spo0J family partition protein